MLKKPYLIAIIVIAAIVLIGMILGIILDGLAACTEMACPCDIDGERPCNSCHTTNPVFVTGIFNVIQECSGQEYVICKDNKFVDRRVDNTGECSYSLRPFNLN
ncbi:MAG: hypothetical protein KKG59_05835 [Nanoarchaeota archaeon]|nr:hypothetical protein [Nanoarchaeota archaeon]